MAKSSPAKPAKETPPKEAVESPQEALLKYLKANKDDVFDFTIPVDYTIPTGSLNLDLEIGGFGPGLHRVGGGPNLGKTPFVLNVIDNFLDEVPNSRALWCKAEGRLSQENAARVRHPIVYDATAWKVGTIYVTRCNIYETWIGMMRDLITNNPTDCRYAFTTDSLDAMNLKNDIVKDISDGNKVAGAPLLTKQLFQKMGLAMSERGHLKFFIGQRSAAIKLDPYTKEMPRQTTGSGGNAAAHFANEALEFEEWYAGSRILERPKDKPGPDNPVLGHTLKVTLRKTAKEKRFTVVEIPIRYGQTGGNSIWREQEIVDNLKPNGLAEVGTSGVVDVLPDLVAELKSLSLEMPASFRSLSKMRVFLEEHKPVADHIYQRLRALVPGRSRQVVV